MIPTFQMFETQDHISAKSLDLKCQEEFNERCKRISYLQTGDLDGAPKILRISLAHGQTKPVSVHGATGCPDHG